MNMKSLNIKCLNDVKQKNELIKYINLLMYDEELGQLEKNIIKLVVNALGAWK